MGLKGGLAGWCLLKLGYLLSWLTSDGGWTFSKVFENANL